MESMWVFALLLACVSAMTLERSRRQADAGCEVDGWQVSGDSEYAGFEHGRTFSMAEAICSACNAVLSPAATQDEENIVKSFNPDKAVWIGATDRDNEGQFVWLDGTPLTYTNWKIGEPDNEGTEVGPANCVYINGKGQWKDNNCELVSKKFVCKRPSVDSAPEEVQEDAAPGEVLEDAAPEEVQEDAAPEEVLEDAAPEEVQEDAAPEEVQEDAAPEEVQEDAAPEEVQEDAAPEEVQEDAAPEEVQEDAAPEEVQGEAVKVAEEPDTQAPENTYQRTVVFMEKPTQPGEYVFFRGGVDHDLREGCTFEASTSACAIPIDVRHETLNISAAYDAWRQGDEFLDWYGQEPGQGAFQGWQPQGSPGLWTTNDPSDERRFHPLNTYGPHYWMLDMDMDCSKTQDGLFEVKAFMSDARAWESDVSGNECQGTEPFSLKSGNHIAKCGALNVFHYNEGRCEIRDL